MAWGCSVGTTEERWWWSCNIGTAVEIDDCGLRHRRNWGDGSCGATTGAQPNTDGCGTDVQLDYWQLWDSRIQVEVVEY